VSIRKVRVLVAEDDEVSGKAARTMLERLGCSVDVVADGSDAVQLFRKQDYDLILMDGHMPSMSGIEATALIRALPGGEATPIIGTTSGRSHQEYLQSGMNEVVPKPFLLENMRYILSRWTRWTGLATSETQA